MQKSVGVFWNRFKEFVRWRISRQMEGQFFAPHQAGEGQDLTLFDFSDPNLFAKWKYTSDVEYKGKSTIKVSQGFVAPSLIRKLRTEAYDIAQASRKRPMFSVEEKQPEKIDESVDEEDIIESEDSEDSENLKNTIIMEGELDLSLAQGTVRLGYASILSDHLFVPLYLQEYDAIHLEVKTCGRPYLLNIKCTESASDTLYQAVFTTQPNEWGIVEIPFKTFLSTWKGMVEQDFHPLNTRHLIRVSILMAHRKEGPYRLELHTLKLISANKAEKRFNHKIDRVPKDL